MLSFKSALLSSILLLQLASKVTAYTSLGCWGDAGAPNRALSYRLPEGGSNIMTLKFCVETCANLGYAFAGTQYGDYCFCGNDAQEYQRYGTKDNCNMDCKQDPAGNGNCGGSWANEVWDTSDLTSGVVVAPTPEEATPEATPPPYETLGCFRDAGAPNRAMELHLPESGTGMMTLKHCVDECKFKGYTYAGTQYGDHCFCGNEYDKHGEATNCNMDCRGDADGKGFCGGSWANQVWLTSSSDAVPPPVPEGYIGCYKDNGARDMDFVLPGSGGGSMTVQKCLDGCKQFGYLYAGAQFGGHCFCGNEYGSLGPATNCNMDCDGECGGSWANSIYESGGDGNVRFGRSEGGSECIATGWGDPHIITFDGLKYDVHVQSEMTFLKSKNTDFTIQARLEPVPIGAKPMVTTGIVVKEADAALPTVQVSLAKSSASQDAVFIRDTCYVQLYVDGVVRDITTGTGTDDAHVMNFGRLIKVEYPSTNLRLDIEVGFWKNTCYFSIDFILMDCRPGDDLIGLLGSPDGDKTNDWMDPEGNPITIPTGSSAFFFEPAFDYAIENWCIADEEKSHFAYEPGYAFADYENCLAAYDPTLEDIITAAQNNPDSDGSTVCGPTDLGCFIETETLGTEAGEAYLHDPAVVAATETEEVETPDTPDVPDVPGTPDSPAESPASAPEVDDSSSGLTPSGSNGDPHFKTWHNEHFEYHGQCDMILTKDPKFANGLGIEVQIRTKLVRFWSYIKSAAIRIGDDILELEGVSASAEDGEETNYWINLQHQGELKTVGGFPVTLKKASHARRYLTIDLDSKFPGQKIVLGTYKEFVKVDFVNPSEGAFGNTVGMLGNYNSGETLARNGSTALHSFSLLGQEWQVRPDEDMLFRNVEKPQFPKKCIEPEDPQGQRRRRLAESTISVEAAEAACASLKDPLAIKDCVYDILATQDLDMVGAF